MEHKKIRVGIADDHVVVCAGLERLFANCPDLTLVGTAADGREALELVKSAALDVLVIDIAMPEHGAVDVMARMQTASPHTGIVVFSGFPERQFAPQLVRLGARGYVDKAAPLTRLLEAVRTVAAGGRFFAAPPQIPKPAALPEEDADSPQADQDTADGSSLTSREFQIFLRLATGETVGNIAQALSLSEVTISTHRARILEKLALKSNAQITRYALENRFMT